MIFPDSLASVIEDFKKFPGIGEKTAERMAFSLLNMSDDDIKKFSNDLIDINDKITKCEVCGTLAEGKFCKVCTDKSRDDHIICVVEDSKDVFIFEKNGMFDGKYHVLGGLISPIDGVGPDDLSIEKLITRVKENDVTEIILAIKGTIEGETTALYIKRVFENVDVCVSRIASGIPIGAEMDYVDTLTLETALKNRKEF